MRFIKSKKGVALLVSLVVVGAAAFGAYAFLTASGTGNGQSSVATPSNWVLSQNGTGPCVGYTGYCDPGSLYPPTPDPLSTVYITNNNVGPLTVQSVKVTITSIAGPTDGTTTGDCNESYFGFAHGDPGWVFASPSPLDPNDSADQGTAGPGTTATYTFPANTTVAGGGAYLTLPALSLVLLDNGKNQDACEAASVSLTTNVT